MDSAVKRTKSNEQSQEGEKEIASAIETNSDIEAIEDTKNCLTNEGLALTTTNVYVNSDVARQINSFNVYNNAKSVGIFDYNYKIGNLTLETTDTQLDENYYNVKFFTSKIRVELESAKKYYKEVDVESESANICNEEDDDSDSANIYSEEDFESDSAYIYKEEDDDSESGYIFKEEDDDSESGYIFKEENVKLVSAYRIFNEEDIQPENVYKIFNEEIVESESVNNIYNEEDEDVELDGANSTLCENIDFYRRADDHESGQIVGSIFLTDYSLNTVIVIDETNHHKKNYYCCVCDYLVEDEENINLHIKSPNHVKALKLSPPLENNEYIRFIYDQYHCAVCDKLFKGPLLNHFIGTSHILCATFAKNKALNLRQHAPLNEKTNKKKSKTEKRKTKSDRQNGNVLRSKGDLDSVTREDASQENKNLSSPVLAKSAFENNCHVQKSTFPDYYNVSESSYGENSNLLRSISSENYNLSKHKNAYEGNCNLLKSAYQKNCNIPKYEKAYEENSNSLNSANPEIFNFLKYKEAYEENCNLPSLATLEFYNFLKYKEAYERKCNLPNSEIHNFPKYKGAHEENFNFPDPATVEFYNFLKYIEAYEKKFNSLNSISLENYSFPKYNQSYYEENSNLLNSTTPENFNLAKHKKAYEENSNLINSDFLKSSNFLIYKEAYEEKFAPHNLDVPKSSYKEKHNVDFKVDHRSAEIIIRQENESKVNKKVKRNKSKNQMTDDELENLVENLYEAKVFNRNSEFVVEFLGSALRVDLKSYNFIKKLSKFDMFCMICYISVDNQYFDSHIKNVLHVIKVKNADYDPVYGCHLLRPMPCKRYHCTLCNEEFARKTLTTHILSDYHKNQMARSLITDWNCEKPYNEKNRPIVTEKKPEVLPVLESEKILQDNKLKSINSMPAKTEMVSSTDVGLDAKKDSVLPVSQVEEVLEVTELNFTDWMKGKTKIVSSNDLKFDAFTDEVLSEDLNQKIPSVLPVLESEKVLEVTELNFVDWMQEKTEIVSSNDMGLDAKSDKVLSEDLNQELPPVLPVLESEKSLEDSKLKLINSIPEKTEMVSTNDVGLDAKTDEFLSEHLNQELPSVLPVLESEKILENNKLKLINSIPEKTEMVSTNDVGLDAKTDEVLSEDLNQELPLVLPVLESEKILEDNKLKLINLIPEKTEMVFSNEFSF